MGWLGVPRVTATGGARASDPGCSPGVSYPPWLRKGEWAIPLPSPREGLARKTDFNPLMEYETEQVAFYGDRFQI